MRILVVGAGGIGGYFGGRLLEAKKDVTFLVRPKRAAELASSGLQVESRFGNMKISNPPTVLAENLHDTFDLILLSCKAYDLESAMTSFAPAVGPDTMILPLLNGMRHLDVLDQRFGAAHVLGGLCAASLVLDAGRVLHLNDVHFFTFGERDGSRSTRVEEIASAFSGVKFVARLSQKVLLEMWEKWVFIAACAGITCLMRASVGDIVEAGGAGIASSLLNECAGIAAGEGFPPREKSVEGGRTMLTAPNSLFAASMFRDIERNAPIEADHVIGDLLRRGTEKGIASPVLRVAYAHLKSYEARRAREASGD